MGVKTRKQEYNLSVKLGFERTDNYNSCDSPTASETVLLLDLKFALG